MAVDCAEKPQELNDLANSFWPGFKTLCRRKKIYVLGLVCVYGYVGWRDKKTNNPLFWVVKSFLKGFDWKFLSCLLLGLMVSEIPYLVELVNGKFAFGDPCLVEPLCSAFPALMGMVLLDLLLADDLSKTILFPAILVMIILASLGYHFGVAQHSLYGTYAVTGCVFLMSWCIKIGDTRMVGCSESIGDAQKVLPKNSGACMVDVKQGKVRRGKKTITLNREEN